MKTLMILIVMAIAAPAFAESGAMVIESLKISDKKKATVVEDIKANNEKIKENMELIKKLEAQNKELENKNRDLRDLTKSNEQDLKWEECDDCRVTSEKKKVKVSAGN